MAFQFNDCLIPMDFGVNEIYENCCCDVVCQLNNLGDNTTITDLIIFSESDQFSISNIFVDGSPISFPFFVGKTEKFELAFTVCAPSSQPVFDTLTVKIWDSFGSEVFQFPLGSISLQSELGIGSINFDNVPVGSSATAWIPITNSTMCCRNYTVTSNCSNVSLINDSFQMCPTESQSIGVVWTPSESGSTSCFVQISTDCLPFAELQMTGSAIEPTTVGNDVSGKKQTAIDCGDSCGPIRQTQNFNQTIKTTINQISRFTQPKGGGGRGTNFRK